MNLESLIIKLKPVMRRAGEEIMDIYRVGAKPNFKEDGSPVTLADKRSEEIILKALKRLLPEIPVISEEDPKSHTLDVHSKYFLVDPLDGTKGFLDFDGRGSFTVNIGLISNGDPLLGLIYVPVTKQMFFGISKSGSYIEEKEGFIKPIKVRVSDWDGAIAVASEKHRSQKTDQWLKNKNITDVVSASSSMKFCSLAKGEADVYPRFGPTMEWDTAAGHAILLGAGGFVTLGDGKTVLRYGKKNYRNGDFIAWGGLSPQTCFQTNAS